MRQDCILGLFCRFTVDDDSEVEEVEVFDNTPSSRSESGKCLHLNSPLPFNHISLTEKVHVLQSSPENETHKLVSKWATPSFTESNLSQVEPARNPFDAPDAMFVFTH